MERQDTKIRIAIAEDHDSLARSIRDKLILFSETLQFKFRASDGKDLCEKLASDHNVDIVLMDIEMPRMDGIEATAFVKEKYPHIRIIMLTVFDDEDKILRSIQAGANGYLLKEESPERIRDGIQMILKGGAPMSPVIAAKALEILRNSDRFPTELQESEVVLSKRETDVLEQLRQGLDYKSIADNLFISPFTVRKHIENIYTKLQVNNKVSAVQKAQKHHLI
ncbi:DNA-binding response regulator [bacterium]|nr:MAG: DNA-binding response regulator [bacterium]